MNVADHEKNQAAASSVLAAIGLTAGKLIVGVLTGSLGILAEAAHSALDLAAALMTWFAVRLAGKPPDREHPYGHGKVENLSALFETLLLLATCIWVGYSATHRLLLGQVEVEVTAWSFAVMLVSVAVDISRSRMLMRAAKKHSSQALEADALHFQTDIWSSAVVLVGLAGVWAGQRFPQYAWLKNADAVAALGVAGIVILVCGRLGMRSVQALLDAAPSGLDQLVKTTAERVAGVIDCHNVRVRYSGAQLFVDAHILLDGALSLRSAHDLTDDVEEAIRQVAPGADITVHAEPADAERSKA